MIRVTTLTVQLIDEQPDRIRICRIDGESLVTVVIPREDLAKAKSLPNIPQRGVYYLLDEDHGNVSRVYAGQTTQGIARLDAHKAKKEFWNKAVMFLDDDQNISRDVLDVLEAKAIDYVRTHGSYETDNSATPKPYVDPYKEEAIERLHERILFRMAALGYELNRVDQGPAGAPAVFYTKKNGIRGAGRYDKATGHFTVLAGSKVNLDWLQCIRQSDEGRLTWDWRPTVADPKHPRHYEESFKRQIVQLYENGKPAREIKDEYDISHSTLHRWVQGIRDSGSTKAADNRTPEQNEPVELRKRNRQLEMEVDVSEQAAPVFARK